MKRNPTKREVRNSLRGLSVLAIDQAKAKKADIALGIETPEKVRAKPIQRESAEQQCLMLWAKYNAARFPELDLLYAVPNGGARNAITAARLKREGVKAGVPDLHLPVSRGGYHGLWIEMKAPKGRTADSQANWINTLRAQGHRAEVCVGWEAARDVLVEYLTCSM